MLVKNDCLAVDNSCTQAKLLGLLDCRKPVRPVMAAACDDAHTLRLNMNCQPVTIPFDFKSPLLTFWRRSPQKRQARLYPVWHRI